MNDHARPWFVATIRLGRHKMRLRLAHWRAALIVAVVLVAPVLYVLSTGPVVYLANVAGMQNYPWIETIVEGVYAPLILCMDSSESFENGMRAYLELWEPD